MKKLTVCLLVLFLCAFFLQASFWIQKDERLFREAKILIFDEEWRDALEILDELLEEHRDSPLFAEALFYKGTCLKELEGFEVEALRAFKEYIRIDGHNKSLTEEAETSIIDMALSLYEKGRVFYLRDVVDRLDHKESTIRYYAAFELSYVEDKKVAWQAVPVLKQILQDEDRRYRDRAKIALLRIDPDIIGDIEEEPIVFLERLLKISVHKIGKKDPEFFISIPLSLADLVFSVIPEQSRLSMRRKGVDIDRIVSDLTKLKGSVFEIKDDEEGIVIKIWIE